MAGIYCTLDDIEELTDLEAPTTGSEEESAALKRLERVERQIDSYIFWTGSRDAANHRLVLLSEVTDYDAECLRRAVAYQYAYWIRRGDDFMDGQYDSVSGPDFSTSGKLPEISRDTKYALEGSCFERATRGGQGWFLAPGMDSGNPADLWEYGYDL